MEKKFCGMWLEDAALKQVRTAAFRSEKTLAQFMRDAVTAAAKKVLAKK